MMLNLFNLNREPADPLAEIDPNLREIETLLFSLAQTTAADDAYTDIVRIPHARGLRALARLTPGEVEQLASSVLASFELNVNFSAVVDDTPPPTVKDLMTFVREPQLDGKEELVFRWLLTLRGICERSPLPPLASAKTGLTEDGVEAVTAPSISYLQIISKSVVADCVERGVALFQLRYSPEILTSAAREPELFVIQAMARMTTMQPV